MQGKKLSMYLIGLTLLSMMVLINTQTTVIVNNPSAGVASYYYQAPTGGVSAYQTNGVVSFCVQTLGTGFCNQCAYRYYYFNGNCTPVSDLCNTWDNITGACTSCTSDYTLSGTTCVPATTISYLPATVIPNCQQVAANNLCAQCVDRFYNLNGYCQPVSNLCNTYDPLGRCLTCFDGYSIIGPDCVLGGSSNSNNFQNIPNCAQFGNNGVCITCSNGYYVVNGTCQQINKLCNTWNPHTGACMSCVQRYQMVGKNCVLGMTGGPGNYQVTNCARMGPNGMCQKCNNRYYLFNGFCNSVSPLCNAWNSATGACTTCFTGYYISGYGCVLGLKNGSPRL